MADCVAKSAASAAFLKVISSTSLARVSVASGGRRTAHDSSPIMSHIN